MNKLYTAGNFNRDDEINSIVFLDQLQSQFWLPQEIAMAPDLQVWNTLSPEVKTAYIRNLQVLTTLDSWQGDSGINIVGDSLPSHEHLKKSVFAFMAAFENSIHARSYSTIYQTYISPQEIDELFVWGEENKHLQAILKIIEGNYEALDIAHHARVAGNEEMTEEEFKVLQWKAAASAVLLETFLFYSGFYYPLWFGGQGKLKQAAEIIRLIIRDEQVHGLYTGLVAQGWYEEFGSERQTELKKWLDYTLLALYEHELHLIEEIYNPVGLADDVKIFIRYNANKAYMNLGFEPYFQEEVVNPVVLSGLEVGGATHDYFSQKGSGYTKLATESLSEDDWDI